ncbi:MAG: fucose isomerase [bacterium]|nr:fucose isomerase [bacterium]
MPYKLPELAKPQLPQKNEVVLIANGDLRLSANRVCWPAQRDMEKAVTAAFRKEGWRVRRGHAYKKDERHGFIASQKEGMDVFKTIHPDAPLVVAEAVWQYSHHVLHGLATHRGPILTLANWSGQWPGLVGMLNLNGSLTKAGVPYSTLWSKNFTDAFFRKGLREWLETGIVTHDTSHVRNADTFRLPDAEADLGRSLAHQLQTEKAIMGIFDEGCMGMFNAIIPDHLLNPTGVYKERLSQSALWAEMCQVTDKEASAVRSWLERKGLTFVIGKKPKDELTDDQIHSQCKMYIAAVRIAHDFGCATIGIQYQQGLKDICPASDLVEGILNNVDRPPVKARNNGQVLYKGQALPHFNEVDECAGLDGLITNRIWKALRQPPENTLHDLRWGDPYKGRGVNDYVWVFLISGGAPPAHYINGYKGTVSERQPKMYFPLGGGTCKGVSKPGEIVWSRIYVQDNELHMDIGRGGVVKLPDQETNRRWQATTPQWPIMHAVTYGITRDQMMARHKANHIQVAYARNAAAANKALAVKIAFAQELDVKVHVCGTKNGLVD